MSGQKIFNAFIVRPLADLADIPSTAQSPRYYDRQRLPYTVKIAVVFLCRFYLRKTLPYIYYFPSHPTIVACLFEN
jgi:hypothetical protein